MVVLVDSTLLIRLRDQQLSFLEQFDDVELLEVDAMLFDQSMPFDFVFEGEESWCCVLVNFLKHRGRVGCEITKLLVDFLEYTSIFISQLIRGNPFCSLNLFYPFLHGLLLFVILILSLLFNFLYLQRSIDCSVQIHIPTLILYPISNLASNPVLNILNNFFNRSELDFAIIFENTLSAKRFQVSFHEVDSILCQTQFNL